MRAAQRGVTLARGGQRLHLAALDDTWTRRDDLRAALGGRPAHVPVILLAHHPASFWDAARGDVALTLSEHTHGGQIRVPWMPRRSTDLSLGCYTHGRSTLVVHPGLGTVGPPIRLGAPPTIAIHHLTAEPAASAAPCRAVTEPRHVDPGPSLLCP